jgi:hypothetical protein
MTSVAVTQDQAEAMVQTGELVEVRDHAGTAIGFFAPFRMEYAEEYAEMAARAYAAYRDGRRPLTTAEVIAHLESLEKTQ